MVFKCVCVCCVVLLRLVESESGDANKADYGLILAEKAGNSFKPTKPIH